MGIKDPRVPVDLKVTHVEVVAGISALTVDGRGGGCGCVRGAQGRGRWGNVGVGVLPVEEPCEALMPGVV